MSRCLWLLVGVGVGVVASPSVKVASSSLHLNNDNAYVPINGGKLVASSALMC